LEGNVKAAGDAFPVVPISGNANDLVNEFCGAVTGLATTQGSKRVIEDAYAHHCVTKKSLTEYISVLEKACGIVRNVALRF
jgi:hypothetical protein